MAMIRSSCITYPMRFLYLFTFWTEAPFMVIFPYRDRLFEINLPDSRFSIVVLPQPEGPTIAVKVLGSNFPEQGLSMVLILSTLTIFPSASGYSTSTAASTDTFSKIY